MNAPFIRLVVMIIDGCPPTLRTTSALDTVRSSPRTRHASARRQARRQGWSSRLPALFLVPIFSCLALGAVADETLDGPSEPDATTLTAAWAAVSRGEAVAVMRHALAPGTGDPPEFDVDDCATQRNLSDAGREQARRIGAHVANVLGTADVDVLSSPWCRCLDTARLLELGDVRTLPALSSFFRRRENADDRTAELRRWIDERIAREDAPPAVLVTHQVNITALTGGFAASGEIVIVDAEDDILARIAIR